MKIVERESEDLRAASVSASAELGGLPGPEKIEAERRAQLIQKLADAYDIPTDELREFLDDY